MTNPHVATNCPIGFGNYEGPTDTTRAITLDTTRLGNVYYTVGQGTGSKMTQKPRTIMLVKNDSGATLSRNLLIASKTTAGSWPTIIAGLAGALSTVAVGFVEDGYVSGVPDQCIFRMVIEGEHYAQYKTASDALVATVLGQPLNPGANGEVIGQDMTVAAGTATFAQTNTIVGFSKFVTANGTDNGLQQLIYIKMAKVF